MIACLAAFWSNFLTFYENLHIFVMRRNFYISWTENQQMLKNIIKFENIGKNRCRSIPKPQLYHYKWQTCEISKTVKNMIKGCPIKVYTNFSSKICKRKKKAFLFLSFSRQHVKNNRTLLLHFSQHLDKTKHI